MMKVLIDTNVAYTYVTGRAVPFSADIVSMMDLCSLEKFEGILAYHSLSTIWYLTRKADDQQRRDALMTLCDLLTLSGAKNDLVKAALSDKDFKDFEDAMQDCCAIESECDYIITVNTKDFSGYSKIPAITPTEFLQLLAQSETPN